MTERHSNAIRAAVVLTPLALAAWALIAGAAVIVNIISRSL